MDIRCHSPFEPFWFKSRDASGDTFDVVVVKATFDIVDEARLKIAQDQEPVTVADAYFGAPNESSVLYESDLAPYKPRADVVVLGDAHAPGGEPAPSWPVEVRIDEHVASLRVHGPRVFRRDGERWALEALAPAEAVPLRYEHAFGGVFEGKDGETARCAANPIGAGFAPGEPPDSVETIPAPQVEAIGDPVTSPTGEHAPAGFGWIGRAWSPRLPLAGTYDEAWREQQWPLSPHDFDFAFYNGANPALIVDSLRGGERFAATNLSPSGLVSFEVPRWRVDVRFRYRDGKVHRHETILDTFVVDLPKDRVLLTYRVRVPDIGRLRVLDVCMREGR